MSATGSPFSDEVSLAERLRDAAERLSTQATGLAVLALVGAIVLALATWSVQDPSLSHATETAPVNLLGFPGAAIADLMMQMLGLASGAMLIPVAAWAVRLIADNPVGSVARRLVAWLLGSAFACAFFAAIPAPAGWALPSGLGGLVGDAQLYVTGFLLSPIFGGLAAVPAGLAAGVGATVLLAYAGDIALPRLRRRGADDHDGYDDEHSDERVDERDWRTRRDGGRRAGHDESHEDEGDEHDPAGLVPLGLVQHGWLSFKARLRRTVGLKPAPGSARATRSKAAGGTLTSLWRRLVEDEPLEAVPVTGRVEPRFGGDDPWAPPAQEPADGWDDGGWDDSGQDEGGQTDSGWDDGGWGEDDGEDGEVAAQRVTPAKQRLKQGRRASKEAQPSFFGQGYEFPPLRLLAEPKKVRNKTANDTEALEQNARLLETVLEDFGVKGEIINVRPGPVVTLYELEPAPGTKSSRVIGLADDIARSMSAISARVAVVPGRNVIGIELPNSFRETVYLREILASEVFEKSKAKLPLCLGKTIGGEPVLADLARMPHLLIAGTTGSGKSVAVNTMILSLLYRLGPDACKLIMIDPKMLELSVYDGIPHLLSPVVTDPRKAVVALKWTVREMEDRYRKMSKMGVRNIDGFNARVAEASRKGETMVRTVQTGFDRETGEPVYEQEEMDLSPMPFIVVIIDEMADLMMVAGKDIEGAVQRLAQMARAAGIHLITATQRPSVDVITGTIKANFPTRISFQVTSKIDSRTILGEQGAEQLLGQGDMLYMMGGGRITRVHGPFCSDEEVEDVIAFLKQQGTPDYLEEITEETDDGGVEIPGLVSGGEADDLFRKAVEVVLRDGKASTSYVQRRLSIGYNRAATLIERMEEEGIISRPNSKGQREILIGEGADG
ncbi:FtsK/SpoIIIE family DNA translocase [Microbaculum marinisediminis]|uniref:DNA translocase FtsK n=1 Tax=Microbaculum marinisediminis TaxID=2931392 RepID=A0AAW5R040_9HYPH|nr:DNA translocase FtsK [Microbaculum sp. A6E488]MCT8972233.1 DNA translocase FtsK [Microbaculum sp. A6E488]